MDKTNNVISIVSRLPKRSLKPIQIALGDVTFAFSPSMNELLTPGSSSWVPWFEWLAGHLLDATPEALNEALVAEARANGVQTFDVLRAVIDAYADAVRGQVVESVEEAAERPTKRRSSSGGSTKRAPRKSAAGSSLAPVSR